MTKWILAVLMMLFLSLVGIVLLALLLWWLLSRQKAEEPAPPAEIDVALPATENEGLEVESLTEPPALEVELAGVGDARDVPAMDVTVLDAEAEVEEAIPEVEAEAPVEDAEPPPADDLTRIAGVGPKIASVLQAAGIRTFADLEATDVDRLEEVLEAESPRLLRLSDPSTWPEQAQLAAAGEWEALEALQGTLRGGRRR